MLDQHDLVYKLSVSGVISASSFLVLGDCSACSASGVLGVCIAVCVVLR